MLFLVATAVLLFLTILITTIGRRLSDCLPTHLQESASFYISPILGLAALVLIATLYGWLFPFKPVLSLGIVIVLFVFGVAFEKNRLGLYYDWLIISLFAVIVTVPIFASAIRFNGFNPFTDIFTYLVHGQWLQEHSFSQHACASGFFPAETQVVLYQNAGHRMGGSFLLGFIQSLFKLEWSYYAFLPTVGIAFSAACLVIGAIIRQVFPKATKSVCIMLSTLPAFSMNGFVFGAQWGFFPQTFGLAFSFGIIFLIPGLFTNVVHYNPERKIQILYAIPLAVCFSAFLICYNDMFPVIGTVILLFIAVLLARHWKQRKSILYFTIIFSIQTLILINIEGIRIFRNFIHTVLGAGTGSVNFGWPVLWAPIQFIALSFGMKSPFNDGALGIDTILSVWLFPVCLVLITFILYKVLKEKPWNFSLLFIICANIILWAVFIKFRYATISMNGGIGHTFLQFKIAKWLAPFNLALLGILITWVFINSGNYRKICVTMFMGAFLIGMGIQSRTITKLFMQQFQDETMRKYSPFDLFLELRSRVENIPKNKVIYLAIPNEHHKLTQMVAYTLFDRRLSGNYEDGYIRGSIPENERNMPVTSADWIILFKPVPAVSEDPLSRIGPFIIHRSAYPIFQMDSFTGAYATETLNGRTWNWVNNTVEYKFVNLGKVAKAKLHFQYLLAGSPRNLYLELCTYAGKQLATFRIPMSEGWGEFQSPVINTDSENIIIRLKADGNPIRLSGTDARQAKFLIQNISLDNFL